MLNIAMKTGSNFFEWTHRRADGTDFPATVLLTRVNLKGKTFIQATVRDITEQKRAEDTIKNYALNLESEVKRRTTELEMEKRKVEGMSEMKDEFIRNVTHELKTPLSVVLANLTLLKDYSPVGREKDWTKLLDMMERNASRLNHSVNQILSFSRLNEITPKRERTYLNEVVDSVYQEYLPLAVAKGISLELDIEPVIVMGDREMLAIAVGNLASNAVKFTEKGMVRIILRGFRKSATITVEDTGIGMRPNEAKRAFEQFYKANPSAPGTGVGLTVTKEIVEKHGGEIGIESKPGKGSTVTIIIPRGI
ncbi:Methanogenesis regulatory histidine kinase FilI [uncultured archaeon]|nr:Methanogenesis regulatory histidine kinase FilI [uncultured archaeon]